METTHLATDEELNDLTGSIIGAAIEVHRELGPGLLESIYEQCLIYELELRKLKVESQKPLPVYYKNIFLDCIHRLDLVVENKIIVEIKSVQALHHTHGAQLLSYMKLHGSSPIGLLINFNVPLLKNGIIRMRL